MSTWKQILVTGETPILEAIRVIDRSAMQVVFVVDEQQRLLGSVTDGDVRRGVLRGIALTEPVSQIMNPKPFSVHEFESRQNILALMQQKSIRQVPLVDDAGVIRGVELLNELQAPTPLDNWVVLMAGGLGKRLWPLTETTPKPLLQIGGKPILEFILENLAATGFRKFFLCTHYKGEMFRSYFGDGKPWGVQIEYLHEDELTGTAGPLKLLPQKPDRPVLVMNADLVTKVDYASLLRFHVQEQAKATIGVREYEMQIPYGVVNVDRGRIIELREKPVERYFVSAGIYVLDPDVLDRIANQGQFDMTDLFAGLIETGIYPAAFPIREYWIDMGKMEDYQRAQVDFGNQQGGKVEVSF
jgi:dTDP-glucose pyrophosphorylase